MGLRKYINDLEFSKKVNYSSCGRKFENSDLARSVEEATQCVDNEFRSNKINGCIFTLIYPLGWFGVYSLVKFSKWRNSSFYNDISNSSNLILNH
ncbi:MAG: hypothetical protein ABIF18_03680 [archaeon]